LHEIKVAQPAKLGSANTSLPRLLTNPSDPYSHPEIEMANATVEAVYSWYRSLVSNPKYRWWVIGASLLYVVSPIDIAPDFIPFIGQIDDAVVITLLASELVQLLKDRNATIKQQKGEKTIVVDEPMTIDVA
jgi:uncharacterized membrane protein YkvA (DUF1232 family)